MTNSTQHLRPYLWTVPILVLCGLIVYFDSSLNTCHGLVHGFRDLFLEMLLILFIALFFGSQIYKSITQINNRKNRLWASLIVVGASFIAFQGKSTWKELRLRHSILSASFYPDQLDIGRIELIDNENYYALYGHIDWSCSFTYSYKINGDTLFLDGNPIERSAGILANKYIITDTTLIPIGALDRKLERAERMKIEREN